MFVTTGWRVGTITTRAYSDSGDSLWTADFGSNSYCVTIDSNGDVIVGGIDGIKKYDSDGVEQWTLSSIGDINGVATDSSNNIYVVGTSSGGYTVRKLDSTGDFVWGYNHGITTYAVALDSSGNVYIGGNLSGGATTRKLNNSGAVQWSTNEDFTVFGITIRGEVLAVVGQYYSFGRTVRTRNLSGTAGWDAGYGASLYGVTIDSSGNIWTVGDGISSYAQAIRKFSSSGTLLWSGYTDYVYFGVSIDSSDNIYAGGNLKSSYTTRKVNNSGTSQFQTNHETRVTGVVWGNPPVRSNIPGLPISPDCYIPFTTFVTWVPSLLTQIALENIFATLPPIPPDIGGLPVAKIYRVWLTAVDESVMLEVATSSFQCSRRLGDSTWLTVVIPCYSPVLMASITSKLGGEIVVESGYRTPTNDEVMGVLFRATITEIGYEIECYQASITVTARVINNPYVTTARQLYGCYKYSITNNRKSLSCEIDPLLRPGDTVDFDSGSFVVGSIRYSVNSQHGTMELVEE